MRRHWSWFAPKSNFTQYNFHCTSNLAVRTVPWRTQASFFVLNGGNNQCISPRTLITPSLYCILQGNLSFHDNQRCTESVAPRQLSAHRWAAPCAKWPTRLTRLRSCLVRCCHLASLRVRFSIFALPSSDTSSLFYSTTHLLSVILFHSKTLQGCIHVALVIWQIRFLVSLDWFFAQAMCEIRLSLLWQSLMYFSWMTRAAVTLSSSLLVFSSMSLSCLSTSFLFSSTIFFLIFDTDHWIFQVQFHRLKLPNLPCSLLPRVEEGEYT